MKGSLRIITVKGINVFVHWTFLLFIGWVMLVNTQFGNYLPQLGWTVVYVIFVLASVLLHELGHAVVAGIFGIKAQNIILLPIGGIASIEKFPRNSRQELIISAAGPLVNIIIAITLAIFLFPMPGGLKDPRNISITHGYDLIYNLFIVNIILAFVNLLPAFPMDGGRILRALLRLRMNYIRSTSIASFIGKIVAVLLIVSGILSYNLIFALVGVFIILSAGTEEYYLRLKSLVKGVSFRDVLMYEYNNIQAETTVKEAADMLISNYNKYFIVMNDDVPVGTVNRMEIVKAIAERKYDNPVKYLMKENLIFFSGDTLVENALEELAVNPERIYPVLKNGHMIGVINLNHLIEYLLIHKADSKDFARIKSLAGLI